VSNEIAIREDSPEALIARAIDKNVPVETMERLLAMRTQLKQEAAQEAYFQALADFQSNCPPIPKSKAVRDKYGKLRYKYAPLDVIVAAIKGALKAYGFSYTLDRGEQTPDTVEAVCIIHHVAGHSEKSTFGVPIDTDSYMNAPQKAASALTYAKRYAFCNALGIMTADEDDDANSSSDGPSAQDPRPAVTHTHVPTGQPMERKNHAGSKPQQRAQAKDEEPVWLDLETILEAAHKDGTIKDDMYDIWVAKLKKREGVVQSIAVTVKDLCGVSTNLDMF